MHETPFTPDPYRDIPVAYAIFKALMNDDRSRCIDSRYLFVNERYSAMVQKTPEELLGRSFTSLYAEADPRWLEYCHRAVANRETVHDIIYAPEIGHWLDFTVSPLPEPDVVAYTFTNVDHQQEIATSIKRLNAMSDIVLQITRQLNSSEDYRSCMNHALAQLSAYIKPDRLYVLETDGVTVSNTFEWCAEGISSEMGTLQNLSYDEYIGGWKNYIEDGSVVIPNIEMLREHDPVDYANLKRQGIKRLMCAPFYSKGDIVGYLGADNYEETDSINTKTILESVSYFMGSKIANHKLVSQLEYLSHHDGLTGVGNRTALSQKVDALSHMGGSVGVIFADVNGLKEINDAHGHSAGDEVLQSAAHMLSGIWGAANVYREGGDEFVVLLPLIPRNDFDRGCMKFVQQNGKDGGHRLAFGATWLDDASRVNDVITEADNLMYQDKTEYYNRSQRGRNVR